MSQSECVRVCPCVCGGADDSFILDKPLRAQKCNWGIWEMLHSVSPLRIGFVRSFFKSKRMTISYLSRSEPTPSALAARTMYRSRSTPPTHS